MMQPFINQINTMYHMYVFSYRTVYGTGSLVKNYVKSCIEKFEAITNVQAMATVLSAFIQMCVSFISVIDFYACFIYINRGDFEVQFYHPNTYESRIKHENVSVFQLFYDMTNTTMFKRSIQSNEKEGKLVYHRVYHRIFWSKSVFYRCVYNYMYDVMLRIYEK